MNLSFGSICANIYYSFIQFQNNSTGEPQPDILKNFVAKFPLRLVKSFGALKKSCSDCVFPIDSLKQFYKFFTLADMVLDTLQHASISEHLAHYFLCDIIYFCLYYMESATLNDMQKLAIIAVENFINKMKNIKEIEKFFEKNLYFITKSMVKVYEKSDNLEVQNKIVTICEKFVENYKNCISDKENFIREFSVDTKFANVLSILNTLPSSSQIANNWQKSFDIFLENSNSTIDGLRTLQQNVSIVDSFGNKLYLKLINIYFRFHHIDIYYQLTAN